MLRKIWYVAAKDLLQLRKDRLGSIWLLALPIIMMVVLGSLFGSVSSNSSSVAATLPVIDNDQSMMSVQFINALKNTPSLKVVLATGEQKMRRAVRNNDQVALLIIPAGFGTAVTNGRSMQAAFYSVSGNNDQRVAIANYSVQRVAQSFSFAAVMGHSIAAAQRAAGVPINSTLTAELTRKATLELARTPAISIQNVNAAGVKINFQDQIVPGYALMFALFGVTAAAGSLLEEKESGTLKRLLIAPLPPFALLGGKALSLFIQSLAQLSLLFAVGIFLFKIDVGPSVPALILLLIGTSMACTGLGMVLVSIVRTQRQLRPVSTLIVLTFSAIGGAWFPVTLEPQWLQNISKIVLTSWAMQGFNGLMIFGKDVASVIPNIIVLFAYGIVCFLISVKLFKFQVAK